MMPRPDANPLHREADVPFLIGSYAPSQVPELQSEAGERLLQKLISVQAHWSCAAQAQLTPWDDLGDTYVMVVAKHVSSKGEAGFRRVVHYSPLHYRETDRAGDAHVHSLELLATTAEDRSTTTPDLIPHVQRNVVARFPSKFVYVTRAPAALAPSQLNWAGMISEGDDAD